MDYNNLEKINAKIGNKNYSLLVASSEEEKEIGLQNVESLDNNEGMLFDYSEELPNELSFWMKDTTIPLDIIFINEDDRVIKVLKGSPESEEYLTCNEEPIKYVIEVNQNSGIKKNDEVDIEDNEFQFPANSMFILNPDGSIQFTLEGGERIFSRVSSKNIIRKAKKALATGLDSDYKALGRYIFNELDAQESRKPQYVETPN